MTWNSQWLYTPATGATNAAPGQIIASANWNAVHSDFAGALTQIGQQSIVLLNVNFNSPNTDSNIPIALPTGMTSYMIDSIRIVGASASLTTATCGVFTAASGAGTAIVTSGTAVTVSTPSPNTLNNAQVLTINNQGTMSYNLTTLYFRVQTAQGSAATATVIVRIIPMP